MNISLTPVLEDMVKAKVESGYYNNASEVIREALRLMGMNELVLNQAKLQLLQKHLNEGVLDIAQGNITVLNNSTDISNLFNEVKHGDKIST